MGISVRLVNKQCLPLYLFLVGGLRDIFTFLLASFLSHPIFLQHAFIISIIEKNTTDTTLKIPCEVVNSCLWKDLYCHHSKMGRRNC